MLSLGSGEPTKAICSSRIAQAFQSVRYPILPLVSAQPAPRADCNDCREERYRIRHHSLFAPRDFDISPCFGIVKPTLEERFDYRTLQWEPSEDDSGGVNPEALSADRLEPTARVAPVALSRPGPSELIPSDRV
jgi:hypothetical protein